MTSVFLLLLGLCVWSSAASSCLTPIIDLQENQTYLVDLLDPSCVNPTWVEIDCEYPSIGKGPTAWFRWVPTATGSYDISTRAPGTSIDTVLAYGTSCDVETFLDCNDDATTTYPGSCGYGSYCSAMTVSVNQNLTYYIAVNQWWAGNTGTAIGAAIQLAVVPYDGLVHLTPPQSTANPYCETVTTREEAVADCAVDYSNSVPAACDSAALSCLEDCGSQWSCDILQCYIWCYGNQSECADYTGYLCCTGEIYYASSLDTTWRCNDLDWCPSGAIKINGGLIAGIVLLVIFIILIIALVVLAILRARKLSAARQGTTYDPVERPRPRPKVDLLSESETDKGGDDDDGDDDREEEQEEEHGSSSSSE